MTPTASIPQALLAGSLLAALLSAHLGSSSVDSNTTVRMITGPPLATAQQLALGTIVFIDAGGRFRGVSEGGAVVSLTDLKGGKRLRGIPFPEENLVGVDLGRADLRGANFRHTTFTRVDLSGVRLQTADLRGARFWGANLRGALLEGTRLQGTWYDAGTAWPTDFEPRGRGASPIGPGVNLAGVDLRDAALPAADLSGASMARSNLCRAQLTRAQLSGADLRGAKLLGSDLSAAQLDGVNLAGALYDDTTRWPAGIQPSQRGARAVEPNADLRGADLSDTQIGMDIQGANLGGATLRRIKFFACSLDNTNLRYADLQGADLQGADLRRTLLSGANLKGVSYNRWTRWPPGFNARARGALYVR